MISLAKQFVRAAELGLFIRIELECDCPTPHVWIRAIGGTRYEDTFKGEMRIGLEQCMMLDGRCADSLLAEAVQRLVDATEKRLAERKTEYGR